MANTGEQKKLEDIHPNAYLILCSKCNNHFGKNCLADDTIRYRQYSYKICPEQTFCFVAPQR